MAIDNFCKMLKHSIVSTGLNISAETMKPDVCSEEFDLFMEWMVARVKNTDDIDIEFVDNVYPDWKRWYDAKLAGVDLPPPMCIKPLKPITIYM